MNPILEKINALVDDGLSPIRRSYAEKARLHALTAKVRAIREDVGFAPRVTVATA